MYRRGRGSRRKGKGVARTVNVECRRIGKRKVEVSPKISAGEGGWGEKRWQGWYMLSAGGWGGGR